MNTPKKPNDTCQNHTIKTPDLFDFRIDCSADTCDDPRMAHLGDSRWKLLLPVGAGPPFAH
jgi:hypothetical protein